MVTLSPQQIRNLSPRTRRRLEKQRAERARPKTGRPFREQPVSQITPAQTRAANRANLLKDRQQRLANVRAARARSDARNQAFLEKRQGKRSLGRAITRKAVVEPDARKQAAITKIENRLGIKAGEKFSIDKALANNVTLDTLLTAEAIDQSQADAVTARAMGLRTTRRNTAVIRHNRAVEKQGKAIAELQPFLEGKSKQSFTHNLPAAKLAGLPDHILRDAGYKDKQIAAATKTARRLRRADRRQAPEADTRFGKKLKDTLSEALTFSTVETETFNRKDIGKRYDKLKQNIERDYDQEIRRQGGTPSKLGREQTVKLSIGKKDVWVADVLKAQPELKSIAKETGLASIPVYGTIRTWDESPGWLKAVNVASDIAFIVPGVGFASKGARTVVAARGLKRAGQITRDVAIAEVKAPFNTVLHPIRAVKGTVQPLETLVFPRQVPLSALEIKTATLRIPFEQGAAIAAPGGLNIPRGVSKTLPISQRDVSGKLFTAAERRAQRRKGITPQITESQAMAARDVVTQKAIRGERAVAQLAPGLEAKIPTTLINKFGPAAVHSAPDIRNFLAGAKIGGKLTRDSKGNLLAKASEAEGKSLFLAPGTHSRFVEATSTGLRELDLSEAAWTAIKLKQISDKPVRGSVLIRDPEILARLKASGKPYHGTAEIETILDDVHVPLPSQLLTFRDSLGKKATLAIIGQPFTKRQLAAMKFLGPGETVKSIFRSSGTIRRTKSSALLDKAAKQAEEAQKLFDRAKRLKASGRTKQAESVRAEAKELDDSASRLLRTSQEDSYTSLAHGMNLVQVYYGDQDVSRAFDALAKGPKPRLRDRSLRQDRTTRKGNVPVRRLQLKPTRRGRAGLRPEVVGAARRTQVDVPRRGKVTLPDRTKVGISERSKVVIPDRGKVTIPSRDKVTIPDRAKVTIPERGKVIIPDRTKVVIPEPASGIPPRSRVAIPDRDPALFRGFQLPKGKRLKRGEFPRIVRWRQGAFNIQLDIDSGDKSFGRSKKKLAGKTPRDTFKVITTDRTRPLPQSFRQGSVVIDVTPTSLKFRGVRRRRL